MISPGKQRPADALGGEALAVRTACLCVERFDAHAFVSSIVEGRPSLPDVYQSLNWTCAGICAHESALRGGEIVRLPEFR